MRARVWTGSMETDAESLAIAATVDERADDGLLDISPLESLILHPAAGATAKHEAKPAVTGVSATDGQFIEWIASQLGMWSGENRLAARIMLLRVISADRELHPGGRREDADDD